MRCDKSRLREAALAAGTLRAIASGSASAGGDTDVGSAEGERNGSGSGGESVGQTVGTDEGGGGSVRLAPHELPTAFLAWLRSSFPEQSTGVESRGITLTPRMLAAMPAHLSPASPPPPGL